LYYKIRLNNHIAQSFINIMTFILRLVFKYKIDYYNHVSLWLWYIFIIYVPIYSFIWNALIKLLKHKNKIKKNEKCYKYFRLEWICLFQIYTFWFLRVCLYNIFTRSRINLHLTSHEPNKLRMQKMQNFLSIAYFE
jgi:hypothetical protein